MRPCLGRFANFQNSRLSRRILDQPVISETSEGGWISSYLDYHLDLGSFQSLKGHCPINQGPYQKEIDFIGVPGPEAIPESVEDISLIHRSGFAW